MLAATWLLTGLIGFIPPSSKLDPIPYQTTVTDTGSTVLNQVVAALWGWENVARFLVNVVLVDLQGSLGALTDLNQKLEERGIFLNAIPFDAAPMLVGESLQYLMGGGGRWLGMPGAQSEICLGNQNLQHVLRGGSGDRGIGVLHLDASRLSPADTQAAVRAVRDMDFQAGMAGGVTRIAVPSRSVADSVANLGKQALGLDSRVDAAGHLPDVAGGGSPHGAILGLPKGGNRSLGGQCSRGAPGLT